MARHRSRGEIHDGGEETGGTLEDAGCAKGESRVRGISRDHRDEPILLRTDDWRGGRIVTGNIEPHRPPPIRRDGREIDHLHREDNVVRRAGVRVADWLRYRNRSDVM